MLFASKTLHKLILDHDKSWDHVLARIDSHPHECRKLAVCPTLSDDSGTICKGLPLHAALTVPHHRRAPIRVIRNLLAAFPDSIRMRETGYHRPPLFSALLHSNHPKVLLLLLRRDPTMATTVRDTLQRTSLHYCLANVCGVAVLEAILAAATSSSCLGAVDHRDWMPLHVACGSPFCHFNVTAIHLAMEQYPPALWHRGHDGKLPLTLLQENPHATPELLAMVAKGTKSSSTMHPPPPSRMVVVVATTTTMESTRGSRGVIAGNSSSSNTSSGGGGGGAAAAAVVTGSVGQQHHHHNEEEEDRTMGTSVITWIDGLYQTDE